MASHTPTIHDIARVAGVKKSSVRRYFSGSGIKIAGAAASLGYLPDSPGGISERRNYQHIAIITPFSTAYSFNERVRGALQALPHEDFETFQYHVETVDQLNHFLSGLSVPGVCDGIILMSLPISEENAELLHAGNVPLVSVERMFPGFSGISVDNVEGGRLAARFLNKRGYKKPAFMGDGGNPEYAFSASKLRLYGFEECLDDTGIQLPDSRTVLHKLGADFVPEALSRLMSSDDPPDCLFCASDLEAIVVMKTARDLGLQVPGDLAILGFDNIELSEFLGLSTVDQFLENSGRDAANLVVSQIKDRTRAPETINYELKIRERWTT